MAIFFSTVFSPYLATKVCKYHKQYSARFPIHYVTLHIRYMLQSYSVFGKDICIKPQVVIICKMKNMKRIVEVWHPVWRLDSLSHRLLLLLLFCQTIYMLYISRTRILITGDNHWIIHWSLENVWSHMKWQDVSHHLTVLTDVGTLGISDITLARLDQSNMTHTLV
jgi:hypothetical protein